MDDNVLQYAHSIRLTRVLRRSKYLEMFKN